MPKSQKPPPEKEALEAEVSKALKSGPKTNAQLREALGKEADKPFQPLDRTLQTMRRKGRIKVLPGGRWTTNSVEICPHCEGKGWVRKK